ncbi:hypothetical protein DSBG_2301 [Desulfosporosinus sp. BG]|nr:hypothetical protein DSBG_2301 [Desulfosporosinus sp. BG]
MIANAVTFFSLHFVQTIFIDSHTHHPPKKVGQGFYQEPCK